MLINNVEDLKRITDPQAVRFNLFIDADPLQMLDLLFTWGNAEVIDRCYNSLGVYLTYETNSDLSNSFIFITPNLDNVDLPNDVKQKIEGEQWYEKLVVTHLVDPDWCKHWYSGDPLNIANYTELLEAYTDWVIKGRQMPKSDVGRPKSIIINECQRKKNLLRFKWKEVEEARKNKREVMERLKITCERVYNEYIDLKNTLR